MNVRPVRRLGVEGTTGPVLTVSSSQIPERIDLAGRLAPTSTGMSRMLLRNQFS